MVSKPWTSNCSRNFNGWISSWQCRSLVGLLLTPIMLPAIGFSGPFVLFSSLWLTRWAKGVTSDPRDGPFVSKSKLRLIQAGKTDSPANNSGQLPPLTSPIIKRSKLQGYFVLLSWMPIYFNTVSYYYLLSFILLTSKDHGESFVLKNQLLWDDMLFWISK